MIAAVHLMKRNIHILATGGTIAGAQDGLTRAGYKTAAFSIDQLIKALPQLAQVAVITHEQIANIGSQDMNHDLWFLLAERCRELLNGQVDGIVITHGTDTLEETAYFLSLVVKSEKPIVLVGSMQPATAIGSAGPANLFNAVALAAHRDARERGPLVVLSDVIHYARETQKTNTTQPDSFQSPNRGFAGVLNTGKVFFYSMNTTRHTVNSDFSIEGMLPHNLPYVEIIYGYSNSDGRLIEAAVSQGVQGIVLAGVGNGNASKSTLESLQKAVRSGVVVVRSSRVGSGIVDRNVEIDDNRYGFVAGMELNPQKARILLMLSLLHTKDSKKIQQIFMEY